MKKIIRFNKFFPAAFIISSLIIIAGIVSLCTKGLNWGLEFKPGQNIQVAISETQTSADELASVLKAAGISAEVKEAGSSFQIRAGASDNAESQITQALETKFGQDKVVVEQSQSISAQFSSSLIKSSIILVLATLVLIFIYCVIRFEWDFALASVIAIIHDALIMIAFLSFSGLEFTTTSIAAILTIIGYSINATVVILDRVRSDLKTSDTEDFTQIINRALTGTLSRSIITTVTTLFAVLSLVFYTTGDIRNFAIALVVGLISGCYSSIYIASGFIDFVRKHKKLGKASSKAKIIKLEENNL